MYKIYKQRETFILSIALYGILLIYFYQFILIAGKYKTFTTDEMFYYIEAKAISAYNIYETPASLDGNTSYLGDFGFHGISYALKDGLLAKIFLHATDPPLLWNNFLTCMLTVLLILLYKRFQLNTRLKIALLVVTHYTLFSYTFSYMQETIHYLFTILVLWNLYLIYNSPKSEKTKYLRFYLFIIVIAITFRYNWFLWGLGLLMLSTDFKSFFKWGSIIFALFLFGLFINSYIFAPYPYKQIIEDPTISLKNSTLIDTIYTVIEHFFNNLKIYVTPTDKLDTTIMRYLLLFLLFVNSWLAYAKKNKFVISTSIISWAYFISTLAFYHVYWGYDERALALLNPLLAFSLIGTGNKYLFYPYFAIQLLLLPGVVAETETRNSTSISANNPTYEYQMLENSYSKLASLLNDDVNVVVGANINLIKHGALNHFINFPIVNAKGHTIHYRFYRAGIDLKGTHQPQYLLNPPADAIPSNSRLIYSDSWMQLYKLF